MRSRTVPTLLADTVRRDREHQVRHPRLDREVRTAPSVSTTAGPEGPGGAGQGPASLPAGDYANRIGELVPTAATAWTALSSATSPPGTGSGGEASLVLPDLSTVSVMGGVSGRLLLELGLARPLIVTDAYLSASGRIAAGTSPR